MLKKLDKALTWFENTLIVSGLLSVAFVLFTSVVLRYIFKAGFVWAEEYARYAIVWIVMAGIGAAVRENKHMSISALVDMTKGKKFHFLVNMYVLIVSLIFAVFLVVSGYQLVVSMIAYNQVSPALEIPLWWIYISIPIGGTLMSIRLVQSFFKQLDQYNKDKKEATIQ